MTSTNDEEVKNSSNLGQKNKTHFIELYKSLETRLANESELRARTSVLCEAWSSIHSLCSHSSPDTHPLLLGWIQRHTAKTLLLAEWQSPHSADVRSKFEETLKAFDLEAQKAISERDGDRKQFWETQLLRLSNQYKITLVDPWGHPVLRLLLDQKGDQPNDEQITEWLLEERGEMFVARLRQLSASKCDDLALSLATAVLDRSRPPTNHEAKDDNDDNTGIPDPGGTVTEFATLLKTEAGFTNDLWDLLYDIEMVLLHKMQKTARCIQLAKQIPLRMGYHIVERLRTRLEKFPREKKLWKNSKEVATLVVQVVVARCMVVSVCGGVCRLALYWCSRALVRLVAEGWLHNTLTVLAAPAATARHLHTFATAVEAQSDKSMVPLVCELYVRAITTGMNELERLKLKSEMNAEARLMEKSLSTWFLQLSGVLRNNERVVNECLLTAFSVHPSTEMFARLEAAPELPALKVPKSEASTSEFSWATDSRATNSVFVKTSETLQLNMTTQQATVLSTAVLTEGEKLGLGPELCQDLAVLLGGPRVKTLSWDMDRKELLDNCRQYMERTGAGTKTLTTELKYLNLDPAKMQHLREENYEDENDIYYGIEKGYEYLLETRQELPEEIWQVEHEKVSGDWSSDSSEVILPSKGRRARRHSSDEDVDPLSLLADMKYGKENFKQKNDKSRRKERSKERSKTNKKSDGSHSKDRRKDSKLSDKTTVTSDEGHKAVQPMSDLIGVKVSHTDSPQESTKKERRNKKKERRRQEKLNKNNAPNFTQRAVQENNNAGLPMDSVKFQNYSINKSVNETPQNGYAGYPNVNMSLTFNESTNMHPCTSTNAEIRENIARLIEYRKVKSDQNYNQNMKVHDSHIYGNKYNQYIQNMPTSSNVQSNPPIDYIKKHYPELDMDTGSRTNSVDKPHYNSRTISENRTTTQYNKYLSDDKISQQLSMRKSVISTKAEVSHSQSANPTRVKDFIKGLHESINVTAKNVEIDKKGKGVFSLKSVFAGNNIKHANQSAKTNINTTYSRLNYLHKTKMNEANKSKQVSSGAALTPDRESLLKDLDKELAEFKTIKLQALAEPDYKPKLPIQTVNNSRLTYDLKKGQRTNSQTTCPVRNSTSTKDFNKPRKGHNQQTNLIKRPIPIVHDQRNKSPIVRQPQHFKATGRPGISQPLVVNINKSIPNADNISKEDILSPENIIKSLVRDHTNVPKQNVSIQTSTDFEAFVPESIIVGRTMQEVFNNNNNIGKSSNTKKGGSRKYTKCTKTSQPAANDVGPKQDWVSVMNQILAHRTPKRGENALNMTLKNQNLEISSDCVPLNLTKTPVKVLPEALIGKPIQPISATEKILDTKQISKPKPLTPKTPDLTQIKNPNLASVASDEVTEILNYKLVPPKIQETTELNPLAIPVKTIHIPEKVNDNQDKRLPDLAHKVLPEDYIDDIQVEKMINADLLDIREDLADLDCDGLLDDLFDNELLQEISELTSDEETSKVENGVNIAKRASAKSLIDLFATEQSAPFTQNPIKAKSKKPIETIIDSSCIGMKVQNGHLIAPKTIKSVIVKSNDQSAGISILTPVLDSQKDNITTNVVSEDHQIPYVLENVPLCDLPEDILPTVTHETPLDDVSNTIQNKTSVILPQPSIVRQPNDMLLLLGTRVLYSNYPAVRLTPVSQNLPQNTYIANEVPPAFVDGYIPTYNNDANEELNFVNSQFKTINDSPDLNKTYESFKPDSQQEHVSITNTIAQPDDVKLAATPVITQNIENVICTNVKLQPDINPIIQYNISKTSVHQKNTTDLEQLHKDTIKPQTSQVKHHTEECGSVDSFKNMAVNANNAQETLQPIPKDQCLKNVMPSNIKLFTSVKTAQQNSCSENVNITSDTLICPPVSIMPKFVDKCESGAEKLKITISGKKATRCMTKTKAEKSQFKIKTHKVISPQTKPQTDKPKNYCNIITTVSRFANQNTTDTLTVDDFNKERINKKRHAILNRNVHHKLYYPPIPLHDVAVKQNKNITLKKDDTQHSPLNNPKKPDRNANITNDTKRDLQSTSSNAPVKSLDNVIQDMKDKHISHGLNNTIVNNATKHSCMSKNNTESDNSTNDFIDFEQELKSSKILKTTPKCDNAIPRISENNNNFSKKKSQKKHALIQRPKQLKSAELKSSKILKSTPKCDDAIPHISEDNNNFSNVKLDKKNELIQKPKQMKSAELKSSKILKTIPKCDDAIPHISEDNNNFSNEKLEKKHELIQKPKQIKSAQTCKQIKVHEKHNAEASTSPGKKIILSTIFPTKPKIDVNFLKNSLPSTPDGPEIVSVTALKSNSTNPFAKCVKIKLSDGKCYKATVSSDKDVNMEAFLHNDVLSKSISRLSNNKKYTLNLTQTSDLSKGNTVTKVSIKERPGSSKINKEVLDTINLLSDDEEREDRKFITEFGTYSVSNILDDEIFLKHQTKFALKSKVVLERYQKKQQDLRSPRELVKPPTPIDTIILSDSDEEDVKIIELDCKLTQNCIVKLTRCDGIVNKLLFNKKCVVKLNTFDVPMLNTSGQTSPVMEAYAMMTSLETRRPFSTFMNVDTQNVNDCEAEWYNSKQIYSTYWSMFDITGNKIIKDVPNDVQVKNNDFNADQVDRAISPIDLLYPTELIIEKIPTLSSLALDIINYAPLNIVERTINYRVKNLRKKRKLGQSLYMMKTVKSKLVCLERSTLPLNTDNHNNEKKLKRKLEEAGINKPQKENLYKKSTITAELDKVHTEKPNLNTTENMYVLKETHNKPLRIFTIDNDLNETVSVSLNTKYEDEYIPCIYTYGYYERGYKFEMGIESAPNPNDHISSKDANTETAPNTVDLYCHESLPVHKGLELQTRFDIGATNNFNNETIILLENSHKNNMSDTELSDITDGRDEVKEDVFVDLNKNIEKLKRKDKLTIQENSVGKLNSIKLEIIEVPEINVGPVLVDLKEENIVTQQNKKNTHASQESTDGKLNSIKLDIIKVPEVNVESVLIDSKDETIATLQTKDNSQDIKENNDVKFESIKSEILKVPELIVESVLVDSKDENIALKDKDESHDIQKSNDVKLNNIVSGMIEEKLNDESVLIDSQDEKVDAKETKADCVVTVNTYENLNISKSEALSDQNIPSLINTSEKECVIDSLQNINGKHEFESIIDDENVQNVIEISDTNEKSAVEYSAFFEVDDVQSFVEVTTDGLNESFSDEEQITINETETLQFAETNRYKNMNVSATLEDDSLSNNSEEIKENSDLFKEEQTSINLNGITLKGIEYKLPNAETCYVLLPYSSNVSNVDSDVFIQKNGNDSKNDLRNIEVVKEHNKSSVTIPKNDAEKIINSESMGHLSETKPMVKYNVHKIFSERIDKNVFTDFTSQDLDKKVFNIVKPSKTYSTKPIKRLKRKLDMSDVKISGKKYRKNKNIDVFKQAIADSIKQTSYKNEFKRFMDYHNTMKFSYSIQVHDDFIEVEDILRDWPIKSTLEDLDNLSDVYDSSTLFDDLHENRGTNILNRTLLEDINDIISDDDNMLQSQTLDVNFNKGFGERSGRVLHNKTSGSLELSAAALSDVKHIQPCVVSDENKNDVCNAQDPTSILQRHFSFLNMRAKVKSFFEKSFRELENNFYKNKHPKRNQILHNIPGLYDTSFMRPYRVQQRVQVVQVGELPVSASAQNPISCDSRISQVNDASPSQCTEQITPKIEIDENIQTSMTPSKEYTELTTVVAQDLLRADNATRFGNLTTSQSISMSIQFEEDFNAAFGSEIRKEIKSEIKLELDEDHPTRTPLEPNTLPEIKSKIKEEPLEEFNLRRIDSNLTDESIYGEQKDDANNDYYRKFNYYYSNNVDMNATRSELEPPVKTQHERQHFDKSQRESETVTLPHLSYHYLKHGQENNHQILQLPNYQNEASQLLEQHGSEECHQKSRYQSDPSPSEILQQTDQHHSRSEQDIQYESRQSQHQLVKHSHSEVNFQSEFVSELEPAELSQQNTHYQPKLQYHPEQFSHHIDHCEQKNQFESKSQTHPTPDEHHLTVFKSQPEEQCRLEQEQFSHLDRTDQETEIESNSFTDLEPKSHFEPKMSEQHRAIVLENRPESQCELEPNYSSKLQYQSEQFSHHVVSQQEIQIEPESPSHQEPEMHYQAQAEQRRSASENQTILHIQSEMPSRVDPHYPMVSENQQELHYQPKMQPQSGGLHSIVSVNEQKIHYQSEMESQTKQHHPIVTGCQQELNYHPETQSQAEHHSMVSKTQPEPQRAPEPNSGIISEHQSGSETIQEMQHSPGSPSTSELHPQPVPQVFSQHSSQEFGQQSGSQANVEPIYSMDVHTSQESVTSENESAIKKDQIADAMNAAGIKAVDNREESSATIPGNQQDQNGHSPKIETNNAFYKQAAINTVSIQQALAQILPPPLNTENQHPASHVAPQVLHILQGKHASGNQITLVENSHQQGVINPANATQVLHIVQNKPIVTSSNVGQHVQPNTFSGISLVDTGGLQGNQLLHIVNTAPNQKCPNTGQLVKRVNLLTNLTNMQAASDQKMLQFVCKSADGKSIQLNTAPQRGMVLRLQPIDTSTVHAVTTKTDTATSVTPAAVTSAESVNNQESKINTGFEGSYGKFPQNTSPAGEQATSLPKFNQAFGKPVFEEGQKHDEINNDNAHIHNTQNEVQNNGNSINLEQIGQINNPALFIRKTTQTSQPQANLVQQIKQTIPIQTMHGGVIYTRQIPVNIGGGQTINLITVPSTDLIDDGQKQNNQVDVEPSIIKIVPQTPAPNAEVSPEEGNPQLVTNENGQPVLTQMRIKLPMLSKAPQIVHGARMVRPSFFQIQRNVIGGPNQPVYQQLVLTAAPQQAIRLPQPQITRQAKINPPDSPESQLSTSTLEQLREFDMVLEQVKERSTVTQPGTPVTPNSSNESQTPPTDTTDGPSSTTNTSTTLAPPILYSIGGSPAINVTYVRKSTTPVPSTSACIRSPDSSGIVDSPTPAPSSSRRILESKPEGTSKPAKSKSKSKHPRLPPLPPLRVATVPPKPSSQKPLEDEQTTQRILYILAEYKEQVENCPDKNKPAPRRRTNPPINPPGAPSGKRKKSSRRPGPTRDNSPLTGEDGRTMGSEDSSCGTSQGDCNENVDIQSPQQSPRRVARKLIYDPEVNSVLTQPRPAAPRNVIVTDSQSIAMARGAGKPTAVLMPANYLLPMSMVKGGQQIAIVTNRGPKLLVGQSEAPGGGAVLFQRLIGPAGLKPLLARPGVRHVRLPTSALHNIQALNLAATQLAQTEQMVRVDSPPEPQPDLSLAGEPWAEETVEVTTESSSPDTWHMQSADQQDYSFDDSTGEPRQEAIDRTVLKSLSEECEDLGVDSPSASELFPEADLLFANSPSHEHSNDNQQMPQSAVLQSDIDDQASSDHVLPEAKQFLEVTTENNNEIPVDGQQDLEDVNLGFEDVSMVTVSEDGMMDEEEFARSHPNTTFHSEPTDDVPYTIEEVKGRQMTTPALYQNHSTVLMPPTHTVISQATTAGNVQNMRYTDIDNVINSLPETNEQTNLYIRDRIPRYHDNLNESRDMNLLNAIQNRNNHPNTTQVIRRVYCENKRDSKGRWIAKGSPCKNYRDASDNEPEHRLFWEANDNDRCFKPSDDATDSNGHLRIDTVIKEARKHRGECSFNDALPHPPVRTYPPKRTYHAMDDGDRSLSGKTRAGESCHDLDRRRSSVRGVVKRGCHCCNGSSAPKPKKSKTKKPPPVEYHN